MSGLTVTPATQPLADALAILDHWYAANLGELEPHEQLEAAEDVCAVAHGLRRAPLPAPLKEQLERAWEALEVPTNGLVGTSYPYRGRNPPSVGDALERWVEAVRDTPTDGPAMAEARPWLTEILRVAACIAACMARRWPEEGWQPGAELLEEARRIVTTE